LEVIAMKKDMCNLIGIKYPIFQGGMAWVSESTLAAAVSNAGGLGIIAGANAPASHIRDEIKKTKKLTNKPFGLNIMLLSDNADELADIAIEEGVKVITTGAGNPGKYINKWKNADIIVIPVVASVALAKRMERCGADAVIAEGCESGGQRGRKAGYYRSVRFREIYYGSLYEFSGGAYQRQGFGRWKGAEPQKQGSCDSGNLIYGVSAV